MLLGGIMFAETAPSERDRLIDATEKGIADIELMNRGLTEESAPSTGGVGDVLPSAPGQAGSFSLELGGASTTPTDEARAEAWAAENWLLAGMRDLQNQTVAEEATDSENGQMQETPAGGSPDFWLQLMGDSEPADSELEAEDDDEFGAAINPLDQFMTEWLSPAGAEMRALTAEMANTTAASASGGGIQWDGSALSQLDQNPPLSSSSGLRRIGLDRKADANPYLQAMQDERKVRLGGESGSNEGPDPLSRIRTAPAAESPSFTVPVNPSSDLAESPRQPWQPPAKTDEKYFPNLNRF